MNVFITRILYGAEQAFRCRIDDRLFPFPRFGGPRGAARAVTEHVDRLCREQTARGVRRGASLRERKRAYRAGTAPK